jgi:hypothetical protein
MWRRSVEYDDGKAFVKWRNVFDFLLHVDNEKLLGAGIKMFERQDGKYSHKICF